MVEQSSNTSLSSEIEAARMEVAENWGWFVALGAVSVIVGLLAIVFPLVSSIAMKFLFGWLLLFTGIAHILHCFRAQNWRGFLVDLLLGILFIIAGGWLAFFPITGLLALTAFLAMVFIIQGIFEIVLAFQTRPVSGWVYLLVSGIIAVVAGVLIWQGLPSTAAWALGVLAGVNLISSGVSYIMMALMSRNASPASVETGVA